MVQYGDTVVLVAAVSASPRPGIDFFPLTVEYREKSFAAGKIPGGRFYKREGRPSNKEVTTARLIDRSIRPHFPKGYMDDTMVTAVVLSADQLNDPDLPCMNGASLALGLSSIPFNDPVASVRVGRVDGQFIMMPTVDQIDDGDMDIIFSVKGESICGIEATCGEVTEADIEAAYAFAEPALREIQAMQQEVIAECGKPTQTYDDESVAEQLIQELDRRYGGGVQEKLVIEDKISRYQAFDALKEQAIEEMAGDEDDEEAPSASDIADAFDKVRSRRMRALTLEQNKRPDGRTPDDLRPISGEVSTLPRTHGSAIFTRGETQALVVCTLGTTTDEEIVTGLYEEYTRKFMLHYNFPAFSVGEIRPERGPGRRDIGHGHLARKAIEPLLPGEEDFPYTIRIVAEVLESSASSSMATVCASTLALMDAGVPIEEPVAGVSIGLVERDGKDQLIADIFYLEDAFGDMDFKVAGTETGVTAIQVDVKNDGLTHRQVADALELARVSRLDILKQMAETLAEPRPNLSELAPRVGTVKIPADKIGMLIGPGGKNVRALQEANDCAIDVEEDGTVYVSGHDVEGFQKVVEYLRMMGAEPEIGKVYTARVVSIKDFGAFLEFMPGVEGLLHISEVSHKRIDKVEDVMQVGDMVEVKLIGVEREGKYRLSRKALLEKPEGAEEGDRDSGKRRGGRRGGRRRRE
jgi:polyribonucleotide nucleotidyltransferase